MKVNGLPVGSSGEELAGDGTRDTRNGVDGMAPLVSHREERETPELKIASEAMSNGDFETAVARLEKALASNQKLRLVRNMLALALARRATLTVERLRRNIEADRNKLLDRINTWRSKTECPVCGGWHPMILTANRSPVCYLCVDKYRSVIDGSWRRHQITDRIKALAPDLDRAVELNPWSTRLRRLRRQWAKIQ